LLGGPRAVGVCGGAEHVGGHNGYRLRARRTRRPG
jgi:hypothetical protein